jgi:hypothetical protein
MATEKSGGISSPDVLRPHIPFFLSDNGFYRDITVARKGMIWGKNA